MRRLLAGGVQARLPGVVPASLIAVVASLVFGGASATAALIPATTCNYDTHARSLADVQHVISVVAVHTGVPTGAAERRSWLVGGFLSSFDSRFATEAGYTASKINITEEGLNKVFQTHLADGSLSAGKSLFNDNVIITRLIADADSVTPLVQSGSGNLQYVVDAGRLIGLDRATGQATSIYTVVTRSGGDLVTAFPGTP